MACGWRKRIRGRPRKSLKSAFCETADLTTLHPSMSPKFEQPELPGRNHHSVEIPDDVAERMEHDYFDDGDSEFPPGWLSDIGIPDPVAQSFGEFAELFADSEVENLLVLDRSGGILHRARGKVDSVPFPDSSYLEGTFAVHNHPKGTPPSAMDLELLFLYRFGLVRVITPSRWQFDVAISNQGKGLADFIFTLRSKDDASWAVAEECIRRQGLEISDTERFTRRQHALLMEMARLEFVCYSRRRWTNNPASSEKDA